VEWPVSGLVREFDRVVANRRLVVFEVVAGDADADGVVTLPDFVEFDACMGAGVVENLACSFADFDADTDVDLIDFGGFQAAIGD
jgi:hypothetical protein